MNYILIGNNDWINVSIILPIESRGFAKQLQYYLRAISFNRNGHRQGLAVIASSRQVQTK